MRQSISIVFGALAPPISVQLSAQGFTADINFDDLQRSADDLSRLYILGLISESALQSSRKTILKRVRAVVSEHSA